MPTPSANQLQIRSATHEDFESLGQLMFDAVRHGPSVYSEAQRTAWVPQPRTGTEWNIRLANQLIYVAEHANLMAGFMSLAEGGYIDFAYIRFEYRGHGLFRQLYERIESQAVASDVAELWVHASLTAQPAFSTLGFNIVQKEIVNIGNQTLQRFEMRKRLNNNTADPTARQ